jgi:phospholipid/cholesterol/gamma-HCH transport system ATP-binding protein
VGIEIAVEGLTKSFGRQVIWEDVSLTLPAGEISVMLGPSGTGKSVFLMTLVGLLRPDRGSIWVSGRDVTRLREHDLYAVRKLFGVLFQDGALFGSMSLYDNIAFPLREHTRKSEGEIRRVVTEKMEMVGLLGSEGKLPGQISGGMRKRAGLARALVLDPEIVLFDEPDSGLDPVRTAYLNQLIVDLNCQTGATFLIVTHDIASAQRPGPHRRPRAGHSGPAGGSSPSGAPGQGAGSTSARPVYVAGYDPATGQAIGPDGEPITIGSFGGQQRYLGKDSWTWLLIGPLAG